MKYKLFFLPVLLICITRFSGFSQSNGKLPDSTLPFPIMVKRDLVVKGDPFAQYNELKSMKQRYLNSMFGDFYAEIIKNFEQFLGFPYAGMEGMQTKNLKRKYETLPQSPGPEYKLRSAIDVIKEKAATHSIIIWGEEHHLPQTRSLFEEMLRELWQLGYRYLAAEAFTTEVEKKDLRFVNYNCGLYTRDPVFASAVNLALKLGYTLVSYDNNEKERDKVQAENIYAKTFKKDPGAKVLVIAGRAHSVEEKAQDGWEPMGYWLKKLTALDPFTIYAATMNERLTPEEEHPVYRYVTQNSSPSTIFFLVDTSNNKLYGDGVYSDVYAFFPRMKINHGRPDWMFTQLKRRPVSIPNSLLKKDDEVLVQAFLTDQSPTDVPIDQVVVSGKKTKIKLALPAGNYRIRAIYKDGSVSEDHLIHAF